MEGIRWHGPRSSALLNAFCPQPVPPESSASDFNHRLDPLNEFIQSVGVFFFFFFLWCAPQHTTAKSAGYNTLIKSTVLATLKDPSRE